MKKIVIIICLFLIIPVMTFAQVAVSIKWNTNLDYARKLAETKNQPLVIFFMDNPAGTLSTSVFNNTLTNNLIIEKVNNNFTALRINGDSVLEKEFQVTRIPTLLVVDTYGKEMDRLSGVIGIDQAFALLESTQRNFEEQENQVVQKSSANKSVLIGQVYTYENGKGSFIKKTSEMWEHRTAFYTVQYIQTKEDTRHYYIVSVDKKVHIAVPKTTSSAIWLWKEEENKWVSVEEISIIDMEVE